MRFLACLERTQNICLMFVTLDVSIISGWLNADAPCGVEGGIVVGDFSGKACSRNSWGVFGCMFQACQEAPKTCFSCL